MEYIEWEGESKGPRPPSSPSLLSPPMCHLTQGHGLISAIHAFLMLLVDWIEMDGIWIAWPVPVIPCGWSRAEQVMQGGKAPRI